MIIWQLSRIAITLFGSVSFTFLTPLNDNVFLPASDKFDFVVEFIVVSMPLYMFNKYLNILLNSIQC